MNKVDQHAFLEIAKGVHDGVAVMSIATCAKCAALKKKIDDSGNPHGLVNYEFAPSDADALEFLRDGGYLASPVTFRSDGGTVEVSKATDVEELYEELAL